MVDKYLIDLPDATTSVGTTFYTEQGGVGKSISIDVIESDISITESQISDLGSYQPLASVLTATTASFTTALLSKLDGIESGATADQSGAEIVSAIDTQLGSTTWQTGGGSGTWGSITGTLSSQTDLQSALNAKASTTHTHVASDITSGTFADARISESSVTQYEGVLIITEAQITDLGSYASAGDNISIFTNDANYITSAEAPVQTVNGASGTVVLDADDISDTSTTNKFVTSADITKLGNLSGTNTGDQDLSSFYSAGDDISVNTISIDAITNFLTAAASQSNTITFTAETLTGDRIYTFPNVSGTIIFADNTATVSSKTFDISNVYVARDDRFTFQDSADNTRQARFNLNAISSGTLRFYDLPDASGEIALIDATQTLTNKSGNISQWTNDTGYITGYTVTEGDVTAHQAALAITESQISDLGSYITASSVNTLTNKSGAISQWTNDTGYITGYTVTEGDVTAHQSALSITESQISDLGSYQPLATVLTNTTASFTTAQETKLANIEDFATADQTDAEILTAINNEVGFSTWQVEHSGLAKITVGSTEPTSPSIGDLWIDTN